MESKVKFKSYVLSFRGFGNCASKCGIMLWRREGVPVVVLMVELSDNKGTSVTNYSENIANMVMQLEKITPATLFFEVYQDDLTSKGRKLRKVEDAIDMVEYEWRSNYGLFAYPKWTFCGTGKFKKLLKDFFGVVFDDEFISKIELAQPALKLN